MQGRDISSNNHDGSPFNFAEVKAAGIDVLYVKATQGINYLNPYLIGDVRDAFNNGLAVGVYHFYDPNSGTPAEQADFFLRNGIHAPVGEGFTDLTEFLTLMPVLDYEQGPPMHSVPADFIAALNMRCGLYLNRDFATALDGYSASAAFGWLAWPGWVAEALPSDTAIVQSGQALTQGLGSKPADIDEVLNLAAIRATTPTPTPLPPIPKGTDKEMVSTTQLANGDIVTYVLLPSNEHLLELTRKAGTQGEPGANGWSIIDVTDQFPQQAPA